MNAEMNTAPSGAALVAELALNLHRQDGVGLRIDLPPGTTLTTAELPDGCDLVEEAALQFNSLVARNVIVANAAYETLRSSSGIDADALFERAYELWRDEIGHNDQASGRLLALDSGNTDVLAIGAQRIRSGADVFDVLHLVEAALPYMERIAALSIIELFVAKHEPTKNDMARGALHGALESWLGKRASDALELHTTVLEHLSGLPPVSRTVCLAHQALLKVNWAEEV